MSRAKHRRGISPTIRDIVFGTMGCVILYQQVFVAKNAQPWLLLTALFLFGLIPASWADDLKKRGLNISFNAPPQKEKDDTDDESGAGSS